MSAALPHVAARHHGPPHVICGATRMAGIQHGGGHAPASIVDGGILPQRPSTKVLTLLGAFAIVSTRRRPNGTISRLRTPTIEKGQRHDSFSRPAHRRPRPGAIHQRRLRKLTALTGRSRGRHQAGGPHVRRQPRLRRRGRRRLRRPSRNRRPPHAVGARRDRNRLRTSLANTPGSLNGVDQGVAERPCPNRPLPGSLSAAMYTSGARVRQCPYRASACWLASSRPRSRTTAAPRLEGGS